MKEDMNGKYEKIEHLLKHARPVAPTPQLKDRVTSAAGKRWSRSPSEIPWQVPLRRLAISAAAGVLVVLMADSFSTCIVPRPGHGTSTPATTDSSVPGDVYQTDYGIFVSALSIGGCDWPVVERLTPSERLRQIRELLDETEAMENMGPPGPTAGRSRLVPAAPPAQSWS